MQVENSVALVTGANRGLGLAFAKALLAGGAAKVYAAVRDPHTVQIPGVVAIQLDVTKPDEVAAAALACPDVTLLINNAGIALGSSFLAPDAATAARAEFETNVFGPLSLTQAFAPILARNGGGAVINVLSVLSWLNFPSVATYSASKAAAWSLTNGLRGELAGQGTQVVGVHVGYMDTDMTRGLDAPKTQPEAVARQTLDVLEAGGTEVLADEMSREAKRGLSGLQLAAASH